jgi:hypothetical protein
VRRLERSGSLPLIIRVEKDEPPAAPQRRAWEMFLKGGDKLWAKMMARILAEYRRQRPVRVKWQKAAFGEQGLEQCLPKLSTPAAMKHLIVPVEIRLWRVDLRDRRRHHRHRLRRDLGR